VVGLLVSALSFGNVRAILASARDLLRRTGPPRAFLARESEAGIRRAMEGFKHRWTTGEEIAALLGGLRGVLARFDSLEALFRRGAHRAHETFWPALAEFTRALREAIAPPFRDTRLLPDPGRGSACKRLCLYLRWMIRRDRVDPGGWSGVPRSKLIVPLDTHMFRIARAMDFTRRRTPDARAALEITGAFRRLAPRDPVRYDFALTRLGIRGDMDWDDFAGAPRPALMDQEL